MKKLYFIASIFMVTQSNAQVVNGSFESGGSGSLNGWMQVCFDNFPATSNDVPIGTGQWSLDLTAENSLQSFCQFTYDYIQYLPWLTPGNWQLSYWCKGHGSDGPPATVKVAYENNGSAPSITSQWGNGNSSTNWIYTEEQFYWDGIFPPQDSLILLIAAGSSTNGPLHAYFDDIQIASLNTGIKENEKAKILFRPNPVRNSIHVDLKEQPEELTVVDQMSRNVHINYYQYNLNTLEINLEKLKPGVYTLLIGTKSQNHSLKFVKIN